MDMRDMDILDNLAKYKIFLSVAECKSISKAATQLYISQPAVSITIKKLEENLNTTLFIRKPKGVTLTENGKTLYDSVKQAFNLLSDTEQILKSSKNTGHLNIYSFVLLHIEINSIVQMMKFFSMGISCYSIKIMVPVHI